MRVLIGVLLSSLLLVGCGGSDSPPPPPSGAIQIVNGTSNPIDETYVTPSSSSTWGPNRNGATTIPPTYSITIGDLTPGLWDVKAVSYGTYSTYYAYASDQNVLAGQTIELSFVDYNFSGSLNVTNRDAYHSILYLYIRPSSGTWSADQLSASLAYLSTFQISDLPPGTYDVWCEYSDHDSIIYDSSVASFSVTPINCY